LISRALHLDVFDQPGKKLLFQQPVRSRRLSAVSLKNRPLTEGFRRDVLQDRVNAAYKNWSSTLFLSHQ
jgi:hypothetical protein